MKKQQQTPSLSPDKLAKLANDYRSQAELSCMMANDDAEKEAIASFEKNETACYFRENAKYAIGLAVNRTTALKEGKPIFPFPAIEEDMLVRLLTSQTETDYEIMEVDTDLSDEEAVEAWMTGGLTRTDSISTVATPTTNLQCAFYTALTEYVRTAAICAKRWQSATLLDWAAMIDILENRPCCFLLALPEKDARRLFALERSAADRLRLDKIIAELPSTLPAKKRKAC